MTKSSRSHSQSGNVRFPLGLMLLISTASCGKSDAVADAPTVATIDASHRADDAHPTLIDSAAVTIDARAMTADANSIDAVTVAPDANTTPIAYTTWNPADIGSGLSLSNGNLTVTSSGVGLTRTAISKSSGKWYWEVSADSVTTNMVIGVADGSANVGDYTGSNPDGWGLYGNHGVLHDGALIDSGAGFAAYVQGDIIGCALDMDAQTIQFYKNGAIEGTLITDLGTNMFPSVGAGDQGVQVTANFGATTFSYTPPTGFNAGVY